MKVIDYHKVPLEEVTEEAKGVRVRWLISDKDHAANFAMRLFEVDPEGYTPDHTHDWEHEVFILEGEGEVSIAGQTYSIKKDSVVFVEPGQKHHFTNTGNSRQ